MITWQWQGVLFVPLSCQWEIVGGGVVEWLHDTTWARDHVVLCHCRANENLQLPVSVHWLSHHQLKDCCSQSCHTSSLDLDGVRVIRANEERVERIFLPTTKCLMYGWLFVISHMLFFFFFFFFLGRKAGGDGGRERCKVEWAACGRSHHQIIEAAASADRGASPELPTPRLVGGRSCSWLPLVTCTASRPSDLTGFALRCCSTRDPPPPFYLVRSCTFALPFCLKIWPHHHYRVASKSTSPFASPSTTWHYSTVVDEQNDSLNLGAPFITTRDLFVRHLKEISDDV